MALHSIEDANYDETVVVKKVEETVQGQAQTVREPDKGEVPVHEVRIKTDTVIVDPHHELAVQVLPEGSTVGVTPPIATALDGPTAEDVFASEGEDADQGDADKSAADETVPAGPGTDANLGNQADRDAVGV